MRTSTRAQIRRACMTHLPVDCSHRHADYVRWNVTLVECFFSRIPLSDLKSRCLDGEIHGKRGLGLPIPSDCLRMAYSFQHRSILAINTPPARLPILRLRLPILRLRLSILRLDILRLRITVLRRQLLCGLLVTRSVRPATTCGCWLQHLRDMMSRSSGQLIRSKQHHSLPRISLTWLRARLATTQTATLNTPKHHRVPSSSIQEMCEQGLVRFSAHPEQIMSL
jgi:hypothetical protein